MKRPVRVPEHVLASLGDQLSDDRAEVFRTHDLFEAIEALALTDWWSLPAVPQGPGIRRFTVEAARTVSGYHLLVGLDTWSDHPEAMVVHVIDVWADRWPGVD